MKLLLFIPALASALLAQERPLSFEVASIKPVSSDTFLLPSVPLNSSDAFTPTGGRFSAAAPLGVYILFAYKLNLTPEQIGAVLATLPKWVSTDQFEIQARSAIANTSKDQFRLMMQSLLADRFKLAVHFESKVVPALAAMLVKPGKTGPALRPHMEGAPCKAPVVGAPSRDGLCGAYYLLKKRDGMHAEAHGITMDYLAENLSTLDPLGRPVVNQTDLSGNFDFALDWAPDSPEGPSEDPSFIAAIREQLGIKLEPTKAPVKTLVVDHVERPTEN